MVQHPATSDAREQSGRRPGHRRGRVRAPAKRDNSSHPSSGALNRTTPPQLPQPESPHGDTPLPKTSAPPLSEPVPLDTPRFAELAGTNLVHPTIIETITNDLEFDHMTPVQAATLHELLPPHRKDCLVQAKTGTGKTIAFLIPAIQTMLNHSRGSGSGISVLVISPTRELAMQIATEATNLLQRLPKYRTCIAIGGTNKDREERQILAGCDILIATPGRLYDHLSNEEITYAFRNLDTLILDEADRLLDMGFMNALRDIVKCLPDKLETRRQGMCFSATMAPHVEKAAGLALSRGYTFISTIPKGEINTHQRVEQLLVQVPTFSSVVPALVGCVRQEAAQHSSFKAIIFAPTANIADFYGHVLDAMSGLPTVLVLHSRISQNKRTKITNEFRDSTAALLVATDVVARGMDFPGVTTVFQVGIPSDKQSYIHRLGRTGRADADGRGIFIVCDAEEWFPKWTLKEIGFIQQEADVSSTTEVLEIATKMDDNDKTKTYQAWLGYYNNHLKNLKWDKVELVKQGNLYALNGLGFPEPPAIAKSTAGKMGLRGTKGLAVVPDPPKPRRNGGQGSRGQDGKRGGKR